MIYIFDFDGTLVDSMEIFSRSMVRILDENNILYPDNIVEIFRKYNIRYFFYIKVQRIMQ